MNCPRCQTTLHIETITEKNGNIEVDVCAQCEGIWFDEGELNQVENISEPVWLERRKIPSEYDQLTALYCPKCPGEVLMKKAEHPRDHKVILDYCETCRGIWLDGGELAAIQKESWLSALVHLWRKLH